MSRLRVRRRQLLKVGLGTLAALPFVRGLGVSAQASRPLNFICSSTVAAP